MPLKWSEIFVELKQSIIRLLDYESRCNLRQCSANDKLVVDSTPFTPNWFEILETDRLKADQTILEIKIDTFRISFTGKNTTCIRRSWSNLEVQKFTNLLFENAYDVAKRYIDRMSVNGVIEADKISISATNLIPLDHWKLRCKHMSLIEVKSDLPWLQKTDPRLKSLKLDVWGSSEISKLPHMFTVSDSFRMFSDSDITDEMLKRMKATNLCIKSMDITTDGLKYTLERFLRFGRREDSMEFEVILLEGVDARSLVDRGVRMEVETFRDEDQDQDDYSIRILDGFVNVHGVQDIRLLSCRHYGSMVEVICKVESDNNK